MAERGAYIQSLTQDHSSKLMCTEDVHDHLVVLALRRLALAVAAMQPCRQACGLACTAWMCCCFSHGDAPRLACVRVCRTAGTDLGAPHACILKNAIGCAQMCVQADSLQSQCCFRVHGTLDPYIAFSAVRLHYFKCTWQTYYWIGRHASCLARSSCVVCCFPQQRALLHQLACATCRQHTV